MPQVAVKPGEPIEAALRRFKRLCEKAGILPALRKTEYVKPSEDRKRKRAAAVKRLKKKLQREKLQD